MLFLLSYLIFQGAATVSFSESTLTVTDQGAITSGDVSNYKDQTKELIISYTENVEIRSSAFNGFTKLTTISIQCRQLTIKQNTFDECSSITTLSIDTQNLDIDPGVFSSTNSLTVNYRGTFFNVQMATFITSKIKSLNIDVTGDCSFGLNASSNSYIEELRIRAETISFVENCFQDSKGIQIIELNASQTITFDLSAFINSQIKEIICYAGNSINLYQNCFKGATGMTNVNITSGGTIMVGKLCFEYADIENVNLKSVKDITFIEGSFQYVTNLKKLSIETDGNCEAKINSFHNSAVQEIFIKSGQATSFEQGSFKRTADLRKLTIISNSDITFKIESFLESNVNSMQLYTNGTCTFAQDCYKSTENLMNFEIRAVKGIDFQISCFFNSCVHKVDLYTDGTVRFVQDSFRNSLKMESLTIHADSDVSFGQDAFLDSQIHELSIFWEKGTNGQVILNDQQSTVSFTDGSFKNCNELSTVTINCDNVDIQSNSFQDSKSLSKLDVHANGKATIRSGAFSGCTALTEKNIDAKEKDVADDAFPKSGGHKSSSHKDDDNGEVQPRAETLGNIDINSVYLGVSPNIVLNLNFVLSFFRKVRKTFGHVVPPPDLIHSAIWVSNDGYANDGSVGVLFVYGRYFNSKNSEAFLSNDGAKAYVVTLRQFKEKYPAINPMKIIPHKKWKLFDFIKKVKESGKWGVNDYNWPTNNCQHFTAKLIDILEATRDVKKSDDWIELPKKVLNSLELNEKKRN